jgi:hypothetical protein
MVANFTVMAFASAVDKLRMPRRRPAEGRGCVLSSKRFQTTPRQSKQIQGKWKGIQGKNPWILLDSLVRIGTFQWVTAIPNKNSTAESSPTFESIKSDALRLPTRGAFLRSTAPEGITVGRPRMKSSSSPAATLHPSPPCVIRSAHGPKGTTTSDFRKGIVIVRL